MGSNGTGVVLVEQHVDLGRDIADGVYILSNGGSTAEKPRSTASPLRDEGRKSVRARHDRVLVNPTSAVNPAFRNYNRGGSRRVG